MKKVIIVIDDWNGGEILSFQAESVEKALQTFLNLPRYGGTEATTMKELLEAIKNEFNELPFIWLIIADGEVIYSGITITEIKVN